MDINPVVTVNITRETKVPSQKGFGTPAVISTEASILENLVTEFSSDTFKQELIAAGFTTASEVYKAINAICSQNPKPEKIKVIKQTAPVAQIETVSIITLENEATYAVTVDGVVYEFTADVDATEIEIVTGLAALINSIDQVNAAVAGSTLVITAANAGLGFSVSVDAKMSVAHTALNNGPVEDLIAARDFDDDWYFLGTTTHTKVQSKAIAAYIESEIKLFVGQTSDADSRDLAIANDPNGTLVFLKNKNYDRSIHAWVPADKLGEYKHLGWVGRQATKEPGSSTWKFKNVKGASADKFTSQQLKNVSDKSGNVYVTIGGIDMFQEGIVASGEFIDIMIGTDWIQARIKEQVFGLLTKEEKVPYDNGGIESIGLQVEDVLNKAVGMKILISDDNLDSDGNGMGPKVTVPKRSETTVNDRATRTLNNVKFTGNYAGAIHKVKIDGNLSV